jgi:hypothetical protein
MQEALLLVAKGPCQIRDRSVPERLWIARRLADGLIARGYARVVDHRLRATKAGRCFAAFLRNDPELPKDSDDDAHSPRDPDDVDVAPSPRPRFLTLF